MFFGIITSFGSPLLCLCLYLRIYVSSINNYLLLFLMIALLQLHFLVEKWNLNTNKFYINVWKINGNIFNFNSYLLAVVTNLKICKYIETIVSHLCLMLSTYFFRLYIRFLHSLKFGFVSLCRLLCKVQLSRLFVKSCWLYISLKIIICFIINAEKLTR